MSDHDSLFLCTVYSAFAIRRKPLDTHKNELKRDDIWYVYMYWCRYIFLKFSCGIFLNYCRLKFRFLLSKGFVKAMVFYVHETLIQLNWIIFSMLNSLFDMEFFSREEVACFTESCKNDHIIFCDLNVY